MLRATLSKAMWIGRGAAAVFGLALVLALVLGVGTMALAAVPGDPFRLGQTNGIDRISTLVGNVATPMLRIDNGSTAAGATALDLRVEAGKPPMKVNSVTKVANLNADRLDGKDSTQFADSSHTHSGADIASGTVEADRIEDGQGSNLNADQLDGLDSTQLPHSFYQVLEVFTLASPANGFTGGEAFCDAGDKVVGGGYTDLHPTSHIATDGPSSGSSGTQSGWVITWKTADPNTTDTVGVYALCADFGDTHN
jgi:hypothetical protein